MRVGLIGGVNSSAVTLEKLCEHGADVVSVFGYKPVNSELVSGYCDLEVICNHHNIPFTPFIKINDHADQIQSLQLDILFVVGISQLVNEEIIQSAKVGSIGFHPTKLPKGRGRAPLAWLVHEVEDGAATFFLLEEEADAGAILAQQAFSISPLDAASDAEGKMLEAIKLALDTLIPNLLTGWWDPILQDEMLATEYGVRRPDDGVINWHSPAYDIDRLIKAASKPHPGAFTYQGAYKLIVSSSRIEHVINIKGVVGRILKENNNEYLVQTGNGVIWVKFEACNVNLRVGNLLGYKVETELFELKKQISELYQLIGKDK